MAFNSIIHDNPTLANKKLRKNPISSCLRSGLKGRTEEGVCEGIECSSTVYRRLLLGDNIGKRGEKGKER